MEYKRFQNKYVVRLNSGDEIVESIKELAKKENIRLGTVSGIGAVNKAKIGLYELAKKEYHSAEFMRDMEIVSLAGNITEMNGEVYIHLHIALSDESYGVKAGHLYSATISATGELFIDVIDGAVDRVKDEKIGLNLIDFN